MTTPNVSIVVPVFRGWDHVDPLLAHLPSSCEVIVVDDASGDGGAHRLARRRPDVVLLSRDTNGGFAAAVNTGLERATGDVLVVLNSDVSIDAGALSRLVHHAVTHRAVVGPKTLDPDGTVAPTARRRQTLGRMLAEYFVPLRGLPALDVFLRDVDVAALNAAQAVEVDWLVGACLAFTREAWSLVGPFDERFHMNSEEVDWQLRAAECGIPRLYLPEATIVHVGGSSSGDADRRFLAVWRSRLVFARKHYGRLGVVALRIGMGFAFTLMAPLLAVSASRASRRSWAWDTLRRHFLAVFLPAGGGPPRARAS